jgi:osmotically inducible protein OsmC
VHWEGQGKISTKTGALKQYRYGFASRFEDDRHGTNPEEFLGAACAACFTKALSFACDKAGFATTDVDTQALVSLSRQAEGLVIGRIALTLKAAVSNIDDPKFQDIAAAAKCAWLLSKALFSASVGKALGKRESRLNATVSGSGEVELGLPVFASGDVQTRSRWQSPPWSRPGSMHRQSRISIGGISHDST